MTYPIVVCIMVIVIVAAMLIFIVPTFENLYASLGGTLPLPTRMLMRRLERPAPLLPGGRAGRRRRWCSCSAAGGTDRGR